MEPDLTDMTLSIALEALRCRDFSALELAEAIALLKEESATRKQ